MTRAPYTKPAAFRERMCWTFFWYSSWGSDFNYDFRATVDKRVAPLLVHLRTESSSPQLERLGTKTGAQESTGRHQRVPAG